jgi:trimeric autotransporter adhesin
VNRVRYSVYDTYSNSALNAKPFSITGAEVPKVAAYNESVGGNIMGAIKIPHIYENAAGKTFLFLNYAHTTNEGAINTLSTVPTAAERGGNFCGVAGVQLYDPTSKFSGAPTLLGNGCNLTTGAIPLNPAAGQLLNYIPSQNLPGTVQNFLLQGRLPTNTDVVNLRVTQAINRKFNLNTSYSFSAARANTLGNFPDTAGSSSTRGQSASIGLGHNWSGKLVENTQFTFSRSRSQILSANSFGDNIEAALGIEGVSPEPINYGLPLLQFTSSGTLNDPIPSLTRNQTTGVTDAWTWVLPKHTITFGTSLRRIQLNSDSSPQPRGDFTFNGQMTSPPVADGQVSPVTQEQNAAYEFADFLLGLPYSASVQYGTPQNLYLRSWDFAGYVQDDLRVNSHFTIVPGVRYEIHTPTIEKYNHIANLDMSPDATAVAVVTPGETGPYIGVFPRALIHGDGGHFAPRIGIAWLPPWKKPRTVVRAGYSMFYNETVYSTLVRKFTYQPPFDVAQSLVTSSANVLTFEQGLLPQPGIAITNTSGVSPFYKPGYTQIWTLGTETDLARDWILSLVYTGTKGTNLDLLRSPNRAPLGTPADEVQQDRMIPYATGFTFDQSGANSIYNALQARLVHRFTHGVSAQVQYTYSKSLDNASSIGGAGGVVVQQDGNYAAERGLSSFDMRNQLRITSTYELPFGQQKKFANHGWTLKILGDWRLLNTFTWHTGTPFTAIVGGTASDSSGTGASGSTRADQVGDPNIGVCGGSASAFFNTAAFSAPPIGQYGDSRKDSIEGPCSFTWNLSMNKAFRLGSTDRQKRGEIQWSVTNVTNSVNYSGLGTTFGSSTFGRVTSAAGMRTMSLMLRLNF